MKILRQTFPLTPAPVLRFSAFTAPRRLQPAIPAKYHWHGISSACKLRALADFEIFTWKQTWTSWKWIDILSKIETQWNMLFHRSISFGLKIIWNHTGVLKCRLLKTLAWSRYWYICSKPNHKIFPIIYGNKWKSNNTSTISLVASNECKVS